MVCIKLVSRTGSFAILGFESLYFIENKTHASPDGFAAGWKRVLDCFIEVLKELVGD